MYNNTFYKKQRSTTPKEKDLQLPGSGQSARQQSYKQTPAGYGGATNTSTYKSPSTGGYTSSTTGYKNNANSGYNSYNTSNTGGYTNSVDYGNAVAPVKPVGTVNPSMSAYKQPAAYPSAGLPSAYSANTRYNAPANTAADNTALRSLSAAYKPAVQSPVSATNRLSGYSAPGKIPSPSLQSAYPSASLPSRQTTQQKQQNIVKPLDNFAKHDKIKTETAPQKNYAAYQTAQAAQPAALTQKQRDAVHKQADTLDQLRILMQNRDTPPSEAYKKEMRALYSPDEWKVISGEMPANLWEKQQLQRPYKDLSEARAAGIIPPDEEETVIPPYDLRERMQQIYTANQLPQFEKIPDDDPDRVQKLEEQVRELSRLRWQMDDPNSRSVIEHVYRHDPDVLTVLSGQKSDAELQLQREKLQEELQRFMETTLDYNAYGYKQYRDELSLDEDGNLLLNESYHMRPWGGARPDWDKASKHVMYEQVTEPLPEPAVEKNPMVADLSDEKYTIFMPTVMPETYVGGRVDKDTGEPEPYAAQTLNLSPELQKEIYSMCRVAGVDYYLVLATIAHESGSNPIKANSGSGAAGLMQILPSTWIAYTDTAEVNPKKDKNKTDYSKNETVRKIYNVIGGLNAVTDKFDKYQNVAVGIANYCMWQDENYAFSDSMSQVVNHYGEGSRRSINASAGPGGVLPILAPSTLEILYYRDLLAMQDGQEAWYVGVYYTADGELLSNKETE